MPFCMVSLLYLPYFSHEIIIIIILYKLLLQTLFLKIIVRAAEIINDIHDLGVTRPSLPRILGVCIIRAELQKWCALHSAFSF